MMRKFQLLLFVISITYCNSYSQSNPYRKLENSETLQQELKLVATKTSTIKNSFIQEKHLWMLEEVIISKGIFLFKKPGNVLWQYNTPINYTIAIYNNKFTIDNDGNVSVFDMNSNPLFSEINKMILTAIRGDFIDNPDFKSEFYENDKYIKAQLIPENTNVSSMISSIEIYFGKNDLQVSKVIFFEQGDDYTSIIFSDTQVNLDIPDKEFIYDN